MISRSDPRKLSNTWVHQTVCLINIRPTPSLFQLPSSARQCHSGEQLFLIPVLLGGLYVLFLDSVTQP